MGIRSLFMQTHSMSVELDCPWATFDVDIHYLVHAEDHEQPMQYEILGVYLGDIEISRHMNSDYIFDLIADDFSNADLHPADLGDG